MSKDKGLYRQYKSMERILSYAAKHKERFLEHVDRVVSRISRKDFEEGKDKNAAAILLLYNLYNEPFDITGYCYAVLFFKGYYLVAEKLKIVNDYMHTFLQAMEKHHGEKYPMEIETGTVIVDKIQKGAHGTQEKQVDKDSPGYPFILQGAFTNSLKTIGRRLSADRMKTTQKGIVGTEIEAGNIFFLAYDAVGALPMNAQKTFDMLIEKAAKAIPNDVRTVTETEAAAYTKHVITLDEYVEFTNMKDRKAASKQLEEGLEALFNAVIDASPTAKERKRNGKFNPIDIKAKGRILQNYEYKRGKGEVTFTNNVMQAIISTSSLMPWNHAAYRINGKYNPNSYYLANRLYTDYHMNQSKPNAGRISIKKLITKAPAIPSYAEVMAGDRHIGKRIVDPFERDMDNLILLGILEEWGYCNSKGIPVTDIQAELRDFKTFEGLLISYKLKDYPKPPPKKIETRKKTTRKTAKGQS